MSQTKRFDKRDLGVLNANQESILVGLGLLFVVGILGLLVAAGVNIRIPDVKTAQDAVQSLIAGITGLIIIGAGGVVVLLGAVRGSILTIVLGVVFLLVGLPLVGVYAGLPPALEGLVGVFQTIVDILNSIINGLSKMFGWFK